MPVAMIILVILLKAPNNLHQEAAVLSRKARPCTLTHNHPTEGLPGWDSDLPKVTCQGPAQAPRNVLLSKSLSGRGFGEDPCF